MERLQKCLLRRQNAIYQQKYAMANLKLYYLSQRSKNVSFREGEFIPAMMPSSSKQENNDLDRQNKQLYLRYVQEVLDNKQQELLQYEEHLNQRSLRIQELQGQQRINPLAVNHHAELVSKKIGLLRELAVRMSGYKAQPALLRDLEEFSNSLGVLDDSSRRVYEQARQRALVELDKLSKQRRELSAWKSKITQLQSYEKYLNELQVVLEQKQVQLICKQKEIHDQSMAFYQSHDQTISLNKQGEYNTYQEQNNIQNSDHSMRKRARIFQPRMSSTDIGLKKQSGVNTNGHKTSSKIMQQNSTGDYTKNMQKTSREPQLSQINEQIMMNASSQTNLQDEPKNILLRLSNDHMSLKYIRLWLIFSQRAERGGISHKKIMGLYLWRLNALYDDKAKEKVRLLIKWPRKIHHMTQLANISYKDLSLKKRRYLQMFFEYQRKNMQRNKMLNNLKGVLRNKNRRERTAFYIYFQRFRNNCKVLTFLNTFEGNVHYDNTLSEKPINNISENIRNKLGSSRGHTDSRTIKTSASNYQVRINNQNRIKQAKLTPSSSINSKGKLINQQGINIPKLKEYIKTQEQTQVKLAIQCAQTDAIYRMALTLNAVVFRTKVRFLVNLTRKDENSRLQSIQKSLSSCQFKWQLFMAKARLALTANSNKVAHLEQLVSFLDTR